MYNILTLNNISKVGLNQLDADKYTVGADIENPDAILVRSAKMHDMEFAPNTLAIARAGAGTNNVPVDR
ncbi:MAG: 3-phosphoglycerate dehydrogenase, partial [Clostridia bacterium]|nr:3-phosphoglycerate dehydrogenase [Clostridia bacterium]